MKSSRSEEGGRPTRIRTGVWGGIERGILAVLIQAWDIPAATVIILFPAAQTCRYTHCGGASGKENHIAGKSVSLDSP